MGWSPPIVFILSCLEAPNKGENTRGESSRPHGRRRLYYGRNVRAPLSFAMVAMVVTTAAKWDGGHQFPSFFQPWNLQIREKTLATRTRAQMVGGGFSTYESAFVLLCSPYMASTWQHHVSTNANALTTVLQPAPTVWAQVLVANVFSSVWSFQA